MPFNFNGNTPNSITWNGNTVNKLLYNGTEVWSNTPATFTGLCFTANTAGSTVELIKVFSPSISDTAYSTNGITWTSFTPSETAGTNVVTLTNIGDKVYFRNNITGDCNSDRYMKFVMSGSIAASGNCNSMYDATNFDSLTTLVHNYCFYNLFYGCAALTTAPELPATTLSLNCYVSIFGGCTSLTTSPVLPATNLGQGCYDSMFSNCTNLVHVPELPANTLITACYSAMFSNCTSLQVSDTQTAEAPYAWTIPSSETFASTFNYPYVFNNCLGTRASNSLAAVAGQSVTYYTQNPPVA